MHSEKFSSLDIDGATSLQITRDARRKILVIIHHSLISELS